MALSDYQLVEYIESSGTQYIDTGVKPSDYVMTLRIEADAQYTSADTSAIHYLFGSGYYNSTTANRRNINCGIYPSGSTTKFSYLNGANAGTAVAFTNSTIDTNRHIFGIDQVSKNYIFDDKTQAFTTTINSNVTKPLLVFVGYSTGSSSMPISYYSSVKLYGFKIWNNGSLLMNLLPAKRKSDSVIGMYDTESDTFFTNQGSGTFTAGANAYMISTAVTPVGSGSVSGGGLYVSGSTATLMASALNLRYEFEQWSDGDTNDTRTITVTQDETYTAEFEEIVPSGKLPSRLIPADIIRGSNVYFDTGILPSDTLDITLMFALMSLGTGWFFGSRNTNSNTSAGQFNLYKESQQSYKIGFNNSRIDGGYYFKNQATDFEYAFISNDGFNYECVGYSTGNSGSFTGTYPMYLMACNNAGNVDYGSTPNYSSFVEMSIKESGVETHHFVPVYDTINLEFGIYDLIAGNFLTNQGSGSITGHHLLQADASSGGEAFIKTDSTGLSKSRYMMQTGSLDRTSFWMIAIAKDGYEFLNWTDGNGNIVSYDREYLVTHGISVDTIIKANFVKKTPYVMEQNYQLLGLQYGIRYPQDNDDPQANLSDIYADVISFEIVNDMLTRSTSTIVLKKMPSAYQVDMPVFLFTPKGKLVWCGLIKAIDGNTLTCREALSIYDSEILFRTYSGSQSLYQKIYNIVDSYKFRASSNASDLVGYKSDYSLERKIATLRGMMFSKKVYFGEDLIAFPSITEANVGNLEDYLFSLSDKYGVIFEPYLDSYTNPLYSSKGAKHLLKFEITNPLKYDKMTMGDNTEMVSDINVTEEYQTPTVVTIINTAGTSMRGVFTIKDGTIVDMPDSHLIGVQWGGLTSDYVSYNISDYKVVVSDDRLKTLAIEYLGNAGYNHKITFDIDLNYGLYRFDDFKLGRKVNFYYGDRLFNSVITALRFSTDMHKLSVTLGNVRTKLTTKLNLGKVKK